MNDDAGNLHECLEVIGKEPNPFARVNLLWDTIDAVTNYSHQKSSLAANDASLGQTKETFDQYYEKMLVHYRAKKETLNLLKSCAYTDGAKCQVAANKLLRTLTVKIKSRLVTRKSRSIRRRRHESDQEGVSQSDATSGTFEPSGFAQD